MEEVRRLCCMLSWLVVHSDFRDLCGLLVLLGAWDARISSRLFFCQGLCKCSTVGLTIFMLVSLQHAALSRCGHGFQSVVFNQLIFDSESC